MALELTVLNTSLVQKQSVNEILKCNEVTVNFGLVLTEKQALALVETRLFALKENGRIEFSGGVINKIIYEFCNSFYLSMHNYEKALHELLEIFYYYKNETLDLISDDDLIKNMKTAFDGVCQGSFELLAGRELDKLARNLRYGYSLDHEDDMSTEEENDDG